MHHYSLNRVLLLHEKSHILFLFFSTSPLPPSLATMEFFPPWQFCFFCHTGSMVSEWLLTQAHTHTHFCLFHFFVLDTAHFKSIEPCPTVWICYNLCVHLPTERHLFFSLLVVRNRFSINVNIYDFYIGKDFHWHSLWANNITPESCNKPIFSIVRAQWVVQFVYQSCHIILCFLKPSMEKHSYWSTSPLALGVMAIQILY